MFAEFFCKKRMGCLACTVAIAVFSICIGYAHSFLMIKSIEINEEFYFLISDDTHIEASAELVKWDGGAGYLLEEGGTRYVAITVFMDRASAEIVQQRLLTNGQRTSLLKRGTQKLYFKGKEKEKRELYVSALNLFKNYLVLLEDCITKLENGMTQEACKRILKTIERQFRCAQNLYAGYVAFKEVCGNTINDIVEICTHTVYLKDLRYLLCWQAEKYIQLCDSFAL